MTGPSLTAASDQDAGGAQPNLAARAAAAALTEGESSSVPAVGDASPPQAAPAPASSPKPAGRTRGRPPTRRPGAMPQPAKPATPAAVTPAATPADEIAKAQEAVTQGLVDIFGLVSIARGPAWVITKERAAPAGLHLGRWLAPYMPNLGDWLPLGFGALALAGMVKECAANEAKQKAAAAKNGHQDQAPVAAPASGEEFDGSPS